MNKNDELPVGIENLLCLAALDARLRDALCERPLEVAAAAGIALTTTERAVLGSLAPDEIRRMAARAPLPAPPHRPLFQQVLDAALVALGLAVLGCTNPSNRTMDEANAKPESITSPVRGDEGGAMLPPETDDGPPFPDLRTTRKRAPPYTLRGPRVMPDPHLAKKLATEQPNPRSILESLEAGYEASPGALQNAHITLGDKVIHNDKDLDGYINPPREDFPHLPGARKRDPLHGLMGPRVMPDPHLGKLRKMTDTDARWILGGTRDRDLRSIFGPDSAADPEVLQDVSIRIAGDKVIRNEKELDGVIDVPHKPRGKSK